MPSDPRDYKLDLSTQAGSAPAASPRPYLSVQFACCGVYQRVYRDAHGERYRGRCPKCLRTVNFVVGEGGTDQRIFTVS